MAGALVVASIWVAVLAVPWDVLFRENNPPAPSVASRFLGLMDSGDPINTGWWLLIVVTTLIGLLCLWALWRGLVSMFAPLGSSPARKLRKWGDPVRLIQSFESEARDPFVKVDKPTLIATRSWLMGSDGLNVSLLPVAEIAWVYGKDDKTADAVGGALQFAGVMSSRQRRLAAHMDSVMQENMTLVVHMKAEEFEETLVVKSAIDTIARFFVDHAPHVVVGHNKELEALWKSDREAFLRQGRGLSGDMPPRSGDHAPHPGDDLFGQIGDAVGGLTDIDRR